MVRATSLFGLESLPMIAIFMPSRGCMEPPTEAVDPSEAVAEVELMTLAWLEAVLAGNTRSLALYLYFFLKTTVVIDSKVRMNSAARIWHNPVLLSQFSYCIIWDHWTGVHHHYWKVAPSEVVYIYSSPPPPPPILDLSVEPPPVVMRLYSWSPFIVWIPPSYTIQTLA